MYFRSTNDVRADDDIREERVPFILSQYAASPHLTSLIYSMRDLLNRDDTLELLYQNLFNIEQATGTSLNAWGNIVGISRNVPYNGEYLYLGDDDFRKLIMLKAMANIMDSTMATLNLLFRYLFPRYECYVTQSSEYVQRENGEYYDKNAMNIRFVINGNVTDTEKAIFSYAGTLNKGAGVGVNVIFGDQSTVFGFAGSGLQPFNQGNFYSY